MDNGWQVVPEVLSSKIDEDMVLMSIEAGSYFTLDPIATHIWELLLKNPATTSDLVSQLMEEYDIDNETCVNDVQAFIDDLLSKKLIMVHE